MTYEEMKAKYPTLNWEEAEELEMLGDIDSINAGAEAFDRIKDSLRSKSNNNIKTSNDRL